MLLRHAIALPKTPWAFLRSVFAPTHGRVRMLRMFAGASIDLLDSIAAFRSVDGKQAVISPLICWPSLHRRQISKD
jgi:hypothetical protein